GGRAPPPARGRRKRVPGCRPAPGPAGRGAGSPAAGAPLQRCPQQGGSGRPLRTDATGVDRVGRACPPPGQDHRQRGNLLGRRASPDDRERGGPAPLRPAVLSRSPAGRTFPPPPPPGGPLSGPPSP